MSAEKGKQDLHETVNYDRVGLYVAMGGIAVALVGVAVSIGIAVDQAGKSRDALYQSRIQSRVSVCSDLASYYGEQSWQYAAIVLEEYEKYGVSADALYYDKDKYGRPQPNQRLSEFSHKALATGRAIQICLNKHNTQSNIQSCLESTVEAGENGFWVDDSVPPDTTPDRIVC